MDTYIYNQIHADTYRVTLQRTLVESVCICAYVCICRAYVVHMCAYRCFMLYVCAYVCTFVCIDAPSTFCCKKYMHICTYIHIQHTYSSTYMHIHFQYSKHTYHINRCISGTYMHVYVCICMYLVCIRTVSVCI
jgi:hypothetical protein